MKNIPFILILFFASNLFGQTKKPEDFGFKHLRTIYQKDTIDILVKIKIGDELKTKPIFFFCQGSLPVPLIITEGEKVYPPFPFDTKAICETYHLVIAGKPKIPLIKESKDLQPDFSYIDNKTHQPPIEYSKNNYQEYYVKRNLFVIGYLASQKFIDMKKVVVAGHSQGARIAFEMALNSKKITHLIYASGNPCGQIMSMVAKSRLRENIADSTTYADNDFGYYEAIVADSNNSDGTYGDSYKSTYSFSKSSINTFPKLKIPVLVCYGTNDPGAPFNDYLRAELIRQRKNNFKFQAYIGLDHNFFGIKPTGETDYKNFNWNKVINDWMKWLIGN